MKKIEELKEKKGSFKKIVLWILFILIVVSASVVLYARYLGTSGLVIKEFKITDEAIPSSFHGVKIAHLSDLHYGRITHSKQMDKLVNTINKTKPDIIVLTGDLLDRDRILEEQTIEELSSYLKNMNATLGKYIITGNHDYGREEFSKIIEKSGWTLLDESYDLIYHDSYEPILLSGMSTNLHGEKTISDKMNMIDQYVTDYPDVRYRIMLLHEPDYITKFSYDSYHLVLAGHSHNGQVRIPFIGPLKLPPGAEEYYDTHYSLGNTDLYISSGIGTSTMNFRLFNKPSFHLYRLTTY